MASEGKTSYTKIGFIVVAGIVAVAGSLFYFGGVRGNGEKGVDGKRGENEVLLFAFLRQLFEK